MTTAKKTATKTAKAAPKKVASKCCAKKACASKTCAKKCAKKEQKDEKHKFIIFGLVLTLVLLGSSLGVMTWARYVTNLGTGNATVSVADWKVALKDGHNESYNLESDLALTYSNGWTHVADGKIAPGSKGEAEFVIDLTDTEVDTEYVITFTPSGNTPQNAFIGGAVVAKSTTETPTNTTATVEDASCTKSDSVVTCTGHIELPKNGDKYTAFTEDNGKVAIKVSVDWDDGNQKDTAYTVIDQDAQDAEDTTDAKLEDFTIAVSATAKQYAVSGHGNN